MKTRRAPTLPFNDYLWEAFWLNGMTAGYALYLGLAPTHRPGLLRDALIWAALTGVGTGIAAICIPIVAAAQRRGLMLKGNRANWAAFYLIVAMTCVAAALVRTGAGLLFLPQLHTPVFAIEASAQLLTLFAFYVTFERLRANEQEVAANARHRECLAAELTLAQKEMVQEEDQLRKDLAEFLHGPIQSHLLLAWIRIKSSLQNPAAQQKALEDAAQMLRGVGTADFGKLRELLCKNQSQYSLEEALAKLIDRFQVAIPIEQEWQPEVKAIASRIGYEDQAILLYMIEDCLLNVLRHASANRIHLSARAIKPDTLRLSVLDDGKGFQVSDIQAGLGLKLLEQRLTERGGAWSIQSAPGKGTEVSLDFTLARASR